MAKQERGLEGSISESFNGKQGYPHPSILQPLTGVSDLSAAEGKTMHRKISYLTCVAIFVCSSFVASAQGGGKSQQPTPKKEGDGPTTGPNTAKKRQRPPLKKAGDGPTAGTATDKTVRPDLSVTGAEPICLYHEAKVRVDRFGRNLANSFYVSLKIYRGTTLIESMEQLVAPFTNSFQEIYFTTQTNLLRMEASEQLSCQFTADAHNQVSEISETNNVINENAPLNGNGPHD